MYDLAKLTIKNKAIHEHAKDSLEKKHHHDDGGKAKGNASGGARNANAKNKGQKMNHVSPAKTPKKPVNPQKPLVKVPSMDSGYSTQSQRSNSKVPVGKEKPLVHQNSREVLRNPEDADAASDVSASDPASARTAGSHVTFKDSQSALEFKQKNPLVKQESMGTVS